MEKQLTWLKAKVAIPHIADCFGRSMDILGLNPGGGIDEATEILKTGYTDDASFAAYFPGSPDPIIEVQGIEVFIAAIRAHFDNACYVTTRHLMGNTHVRFESESTATLLSSNITPQSPLSQRLILGDFKPLSFDRFCKQTGF